MTALVVYFAFALVVSFLCSILESALLSVTPSHLAKLEQDRPKIGRKVRAMKSHISLLIFSFHSHHHHVDVVTPFNIGH